MGNNIKLVECPRDAMQGIKDFIPTERKIEYLNKLLTVGFDTLDFGSFVSPKAIPQLKDTKSVLEKLDLSKSNTQLLAIIANQRGALSAAELPEINTLGYPFSVSEEFQKRNTNASIEESLIRVEEIKEIAFKNGKDLVVYLSMAFGNPYEEKWHPDIVAKWTERLYNDFDIRIMALSDTIGSSKKETIQPLFETLINEFSDVEFGAHLHTTPETWEEKISSSYHAGCRRFDGALKGFGGCPMAKDDLTGNMPTEKMIEFFREINEPISIDQSALENTIEKANTLFSEFH